MTVTTYVNVITHALKSPVNQTNDVIKHVKCQDAFTLENLVSIVLSRIMIHKAFKISYQCVYLGLNKGISLTSQFHFSQTY